MANLTDKTYFWGEIFLPNLGDDDELASLNAFIAQYEPEFLNYVLGEEVAADIPLAIKNILVDSTRKISPIANYIFYKYSLNGRTFTTATGQKDLNIQNTFKADDRPKIINAWNKMVDLNQIAHQKMYALGTIGTVNYLNDILNNIPFSHYEGIILSNQTSSIRLFGGIFSYKNKYELPK